MPECKISIFAPPPGKQGPGTNWSVLSPVAYPVQSLSYSTSWGTEPAQANIVYVSNDSPIPIGAACRCTIGRQSILGPWVYMFEGVCESCVPTVSSHGNAWQLTVRDYRRWLGWDKVYATFNNIDDRLINGRRQRRIWHILPQNFNTMRKTWNISTLINADLQAGTPLQDGPLSAAQILQYVLTGPGIETDWSFAYLDASGVIHQDAFHPNMALPVYGLDCMNGKGLDVVLSEICKELGLLFTHFPTNVNPYNLLFAQKGVDGPSVETPVEIADNRVDGTELSNNPTRIRVLGDRNLYQIHDIDMVPDWNQNWTQFYDLAIFEDYVFRNFITWDQASDPDQIIARQEAKSLALEMTLAQFDRAVLGNGQWLDSRRYCGKARNNMPVALYIRNILFRCFRLPTNFWFKNTYGTRLDQFCVEIQDKLLAQVFHDPTTGLTEYDTSLSVDGNCYVIVQGYQVGKDMFNSVRPERFNLNSWKNSQQIWQKIDVRIEDAGDPYSAMIVFDEPVIKSDNLVKLVDNYAVFEAKPSIQIPPVRATLTMAGERFSWFQTDVTTPEASPADTDMGTQLHDDVLNINGLNGEFIVRPGRPMWEIYYADNKSCRYKAIENANNVLKFQYTHDRGGFSAPIMDDSEPYFLHGKCDRVTIEHGPNGSRVTVSKTNERQRINYVPERDLDRTRHLNTLLPGQRELIYERNYAKKIAAAVKNSKDSYKLLSDAFHGNFSDGSMAKEATVNNSGTSVDPKVPVPVGTTFVKRPNSTNSNGSMSGTVAQVHIGKPDDYSEFAGVTVRDGELVTSGGAVIRLQKEGIGLARVMGPASINDTVGLTYFDETLIPSYVQGIGALRTNPDVPVGTILQDVSSGIKLARVQFGLFRGGTEVRAFKIRNIEDDFLNCQSWDGKTLGEETVVIARDYNLRMSKESEVVDGYTIIYTAIDDNTRFAVMPDGNSENQVIYPRYVVGSTAENKWDGVVYAARVTHTGVFYSTPPMPGNPDPPDIEAQWLEIKPARVWVRKYNQDL